MTALFPLIDAEVASWRCEMAGSPMSSLALTPPPPRRGRRGGGPAAPLFDADAAAFAADAAMCVGDPAAARAEADEVRARLRGGESAASAAAVDGWRRGARRGGGAAADGAPDALGVLDSLGVETAAHPAGGRTFTLKSALPALRQIMAASADALATGAAPMAPRALRTAAFRSSLSILLGVPGGGGGGGAAAAAGADPAPYLDRGLALLGERDPYSDLEKRGYAVLDGCLSTAAVAALRVDLGAAFAAGALASDEAAVQVATGARGDAIGWLDGDSERAAARPALGAAIDALLGVAAVLDARRPGYRVPLRVMAARYPGKADAHDRRFRGYRLHRDNEGGSASNGRAVTAILYANPNWSDALGGHLRLYPGRRGRARPRDDDAGVAIAPIGGRVVVFDAALWHQVVPADRARYALTNWITRADLT